MGLFKPDLYRSFAMGFALGAAIVFSTLGIDGARDLASGLVPSVKAASAQ